MSKLTFEKIMQMLAMTTSAMSFMFDKKENAIYFLLFAILYKIKQK